MWTPAERRWRDAVLAAALPLPVDGETAVGPPSPSPEDWARWHAAAPLLMRLGLRGVVWWLTWSPVLRHGRPLHRLDPDRADAVMARFDAQGGFVPRQLRLVLKVVAGMARQVPA